MLKVFLLLPFTERLITWWCVFSVVFRNWSDGLAGKEEE